MTDYNYNIFCEKILPLIKKVQDGQLIPYIDLGLIGYNDAYRWQLDLFEFVRNGNTDGMVLLLEHTPVITLGNNKSRKNLVSDEPGLKMQDIELVQSNRGGDITLHGPGQLVCYLIFNLTHFGRDLTLFVTNLEQVIINILGKYDIQGRRIEKLRGVFVGNDKIASVGLHVSKWITSHGFSFNINIDLGFFKNIIACGLEDLDQTSMQKILGHKIPLDRIKELVIKNMEEIFNIKMFEIKIS